MKDQIVEQVKVMLDERSQRGIKKYGVTLEDNIRENYIQHALEEALDLANYLATLKFQMKTLCREHPNDAELGGIIRQIYES